MDVGNKNGVLIMLLKEPIKVNSLTLDNRIVMPPMATEKSTPSGYVSKDLCDYYEARSKSNIALIITEHSFVTRQGRLSKRQMSIADDSVIEGLKRLEKAIHQGGSKVIAQINHAGSAADPELTGVEAVGPSAIYNPRGKKGVLPRALTIDEIKSLEESYIKAAIRIKRAGFDGVEIHSAHGYFLNQFYSPITNRRNDEYGFDTIENRTRIHTRIIRGIRDVTGSDFVISVRLGGCDYTDGGTTIDDSVKAGALLEKAGADLIDVSGGVCGFILPDKKEPGYFREVSAAIKKNVSIPVMLTGGVTGADAAEKLLESSAADLIGVGRAVYKDAAWASKVLG